MLNDFDLAFLRKVKNVYENTIFADTSLVYNTAYNLVETGELELRFPLVNIYRPLGFKVADEQTLPARRRGIVYTKSVYEDEEGNFVGIDYRNARFLIVNLNYQIDIYAKSLEELNTITQELLFFFNLDPSLVVRQVDIKAGNFYEERYDITFNNGAEERSEVAPLGDRIYHYAISYDVKNARILNFKSTSAIYSIITNLQMGDLITYRTNKGGNYLRVQYLTFAEYMLLRDRDKSTIYIIKDKNNIVYQDEFYDIKDGGSCKSSISVLTSQEYEELQELEKDTLYLVIDD